MEVSTRALFTGVAVGLSLLAALARGAAPCCPAPQKPADSVPKTVTIKATVEEPPSVTIKLGDRCAKAVPHRQGCCDHTGGGNIDVQQPSPDTLVVTMTGAAVAEGSPCKNSLAGVDFDLSQCFQIETADPKLKSVKVTMEARLIGLLRTHCPCCTKKKCGSAEVTTAAATITCDAVPEILSVGVPPKSASCGENLSINDRVGPVCQFIVPGCYTLHQVFGILAVNPNCLCKAPSAEFADGAIDPLWISYKEPFKGAIKKDFGFQVTIRVAPADVEEAKEAPVKEEKKSGGDKKDKKNS